MRKSRNARSAALLGCFGPPDPAGLGRRDRHLSGGATVKQVAYGLGYESPSAFITMFKKAFGKPPATYIAERFKVGP